MDWTGDKNSVFKTLAASSHSGPDRETNDFYATDPKALELLLELEEFNPLIWECACGQGHLSKVLWDYGYGVKSTDLVNRGYGETGIDFLKCDEPFDGDIITNPPYRQAREFVKHALSLISKGNKVAMLLKVLFLESKASRKLFNESPPCRIYVASGRLECAKNGNFTGASAVAYAWFIWEKGYKGAPEIHWFN